MTGALSPTHWAIILVVVLLLVGAKRLPDAARGLGASMRIFKAETAALTENASPTGNGQGQPTGPESDVPSAPKGTTTV